jgi:hypothetical protein
MRNPLGSLFLAVVFCLAIGCTTTKLTWISQPPVEKVSNEVFDAELKPVGIKSGDEQTYKSFILFLRNKTNKELEIIWDNTFFIYNGQKDGNFMFEGIIHEDRNKPKPTDIVSPRSTFTKKIWPNSLVFFYVPEKRAYYEGAWIHRELNPGENGVYLTVRSDGREISERITLVISVQEVN